MGLKGAGEGCGSGQWGCWKWGNSKLRWWVEQLARWVEGGGSRAMLVLVITNGDGGKSMNMMKDGGIERTQTWF
ncbi:hypothetical protein V6N13_142422 [Hibiscus sabdariffa]